MFPRQFTPYTPETDHLIERMRGHASKATITPVLVDTLISGQQDTYYFN